MSKMIMINRTLSVKSSHGCYTFINSCIGVPATIITTEGSRKGSYQVKGVDIVLAYQLIAEPLAKLDAMHCERDGPWNFWPNEVVLISD